jgi:hypothetical protein
MEKAIVSGLLDRPEENTLLVVRPRTQRPERSRSTLSFIVPVK